MITEEEIKTLSDRKFNAKLISAAEERMKSWKELMSLPYRYKEEFKDAEWFHDHVRFFKNTEESRLKKLVHDQQFIFE